jgi:hypothetical protein
MIINKNTDGSDNVFLFDNFHDPYQLENIAEREIVTVDSLKKELNEWLLLTNDSWKY